MCFRRLKGFSYVEYRAQWCNFKALSCILLYYYTVFSLTKVIASYNKQLSPSKELIPGLA